MDDIITDKWVKGRRRKLEWLRGKVKDMRRTQLVEFAKSLYRRPGDHGKETNFDSDLLPNSRSLSIPKGRKINRFTAESILDQLEGDIFAFEEMVLVKKKEIVPCRNQKNI
jgi:hypothetical protein